MRKKTFKIIILMFAEPMPRVCSFFQETEK